MARVGRVVLSAGGKAELWTKWKAGASISEIGRMLGRSAGSVFSALQAKGGFAPTMRKRRQHCLTPAEREDISRGLAGGLSIQQLARQLGRAASTISREVTRNGGRGRYRAQQAEEHMPRRAPEGLCAEHHASPAEPGCEEVAREMVTATSRRLAENHVSRGLQDAGVARDHL